MTFCLFLKSLLLWSIIAVFAIANGLLREKLLAPLFSETLALPISGISLSFIIFLVTWLMFPLISGNTKSTYILVGILWVILTLIFEFLFGHFAAGKPWSVILQGFNVASGNLFILALLSSLMSPFLVSLVRA